MELTYILIIAVAVLCVVLFILQMFLSRKDSSMSGLLLPFIMFCISIVAALGLAVYYSLSEFSAEMVLKVILPFLVLNVPTVILIAIYRSGRRKKHLKELEDKLHKSEKAQFATGYSEQKQE